MHTKEWELYTNGQEARGGGYATLLLLAALLLCVFFLALGAYGYYAAIDEGSIAGDLPNAVMALRATISENEAIAVLLGLEQADAVETAAPLVDDRIRAAADAYIRARQGG